MQTFKTSKSRENILRKIREGLQRASLPMPFPEAEKESDAHVYAMKEGSDEEIFAQAFNALGGKFVFCMDQKELIDSVQILADQRDWRKVICAEKELLEAFTAQNVSIVHPPDLTESMAEACITGCELLVARTGSTIFTSEQWYGRTAPVYYPVHIIIARMNQVVSDIDTGMRALQAKYGDDLPSMINLNTGPSRTADIEKTLVVGVHGPAEVFCFLLAD